MLTNMNSNSMPQAHNQHSTEENYTQGVSIAINPDLLHTKKGNLHFFRHSILICLMGLSFISIPLNSGNEATGHQALAAASHNPKTLSISTLPPKKSPGHDDATLAALTIYFEAKGESFAGKLAVAAVIRNRMIHHFHSDGTVRGTVLRPKQFEPWITKDPDQIPFNPLNVKMQESLLAWKLVQDGREIVNGAVLFFNPDLVKSPRWAQVHRKVAKIGGHEFFHTERI